MIFEWDDAKERTNIKKHGIDFSTAANIFFDTDRIEKYDAIHSVDEDRYITIGSIGGIITVLTVIYTERKNCIRIISARIADKKERKEYYDNQKRN